MPKGKKEYILPTNIEFENFVKKMEKMFTDENLRNFWLGQLHEYSKEQRDIIKKYE